MNMKLIAFVVLSICVYSLVTGQGCDSRNCNASNGSVCNDKGTCECDTCKCEAPYSGPTCEECPTCPSPCELYKGCVGCKIFGTGDLGVLECINQCDYLANYLPVEKEEFDIIKDDDVLCTQLNEEMCQESFKIGGMSMGYRDLYVRTEMDCTVPLPTTTTTLSVIEVGTVDLGKTTEKNGVKYNKGEKEEAGVASGSDKITNVEDNGAFASHRQSMTILLMISSIIASVILH